MIKTSNIKTLIKTLVCISAALCLTIPTIIISAKSANTNNTPDSNNYGLATNMSIDIEDADQEISEGVYQKGTIDGHDFYKLADGLDKITAARKEFIGDLTTLVTPSKSNLVDAVNDCYSLVK